MSTSFNQAKFVKEIFAFMKRNNLTVRDFCYIARCSPSTIYNAQDVDRHPMKLTTARHFEEVMEEFIKASL